MEFHNGESMGLFIDGSNLYSATQSLGFEIDFKKLLLNFQNKGRLLRAYYYTAILEGHENSPMRPFLDWLEYNGYTIVSKMAKEFQDADGQIKLKGNMDIELATDLIIMAEHLNHIFLFSGDVLTNVWAFIMLVKENIIPNNKSKRLFIIVCFD